MIKPRMNACARARVANITWSKELQELLDQLTTEEDLIKKEEIRNVMNIYFLSEIKSVSNISDIGSMSNLDPGKTPEMIPPEDVVDRG
jgi:hypothetical protein